MTNIASELKAIEALIPVFKHDRNYWLLRTDGGDHFQDFTQNKYVAIGYNYLKLDYINNILSKNKKVRDAISTLKRAIDTSDKEENRPKYVATQLINFVDGIMKDDIIIIPSHGSEYFSIGEVIDDTAYSQTPESVNSAKIKGYFPCRYEKRRKIKWLKTCSRYQGGSELFSIFFYHGTLLKINEHAQYIDPLINTFYVKGDKAHLNIKIDTTTQIKGNDFFLFGSDLFTTLDDFAEENELENNSDNIITKVKVRSQGHIELIDNLQTVLIIGAIVVGLAGGAMTFKTNDAAMGINSPGIIERIRKFLDSSAARRKKKEAAQRRMESLKAKPPIELTENLKKSNKSKKKSNKNNNKKNKN